MKGKHTSSLVYVCMYVCMYVPMYTCVHLLLYTTPFPPNTFINSFRVFLR